MRHCSPNRECRTCRKSYLAISMHQGTPQETESGCAVLKATQNTHNRSGWCCGWVAVRLREPIAAWVCNHVRECARMGERTNEHARISAGTNSLACHWQRTKTTMLHACVHVAGAGRVVKLCVVVVNIVYGRSAMHSWTTQCIQSCSLTT